MWFNELFPVKASHYFLVFPPSSTSDVCGAEDQAGLVFTESQMNLWMKCACYFDWNNCIP
ncbi:hypothetical protein CSZ94_26850 [Janthinobacterium sp. ROICE36]|nr:hypothetical protein CSZ94_26850 [Janthinobacterium sp. ROICE36]